MPCDELEQKKNWRRTDKCGEDLFCEARAGRQSHELFTLSWRAFLQAMPLATPAHGRAFA